MGIDRKTVEHVAKLARLELTGEELERYGGQLGAVLDYVEKLKQLDLEGVEPLVHAAEGTNVFRADEPRECLPHEKALGNAPDRNDDFFLVPRVVE